MSDKIDFDLILNDCMEAYGIKGDPTHQYPFWTDHGPLHWQQVERNAIYLAQRTPDAIVDVCRIFALTHDCRRQNEYDDPNHGKRAAAFVVDHLDKWGVRSALPCDAIDLLLTAVRDHDTGGVTSSSTTGCCWDADRLDLTRVRIFPNPKLLSTKAAKDMISENLRKIYLK